MYRDLYRKAGVRDEDIRGLNDISKLPIITKKDIESYYPDGLIPENKNINGRFSRYYLFLKSS